MYRVQDIQTDDISDVSSYYDLLLNNKVDEARTFYEAQDNLKGKVLTADMLNLMLYKIFELQSNYITNVKDFLTNQKESFELDIANLIYMEDWDSNNSYKKNNFVIYDEVIYFALQDCSVGILLSNTSYWLPLSLKGENGSPAMDIVFKGEWNIGVTYQVRDFVNYGLSLYVAKEQNIGKNPITSSKWLKAITLTKTKINVSDTEPLDLKNGDIWFKGTER